MGVVMKHGNDDDDTKEVVVFDLTVASLHGYDATGACIECMVIGTDLCSMHGEHRGDDSDVS